MPELTQEDRLMAVDTPLGTDALVLIAFQGREELSRPFLFKLEMISEDEKLDATKIVGKQVTFKVAVGVGQVADQFRYFNGHVRRFAAGKHEAWEGGLRHYWAEVVPWLSLLDRTANCRIFQDQTVPQILEQIFEDHGFDDYENELKGDYPELEFCVQYRETDFQFVSRLMEEAGIFYYFTHEDKKHTLVLADHKGAYVDCEEAEVEHFANFDALLPSQILRWEHQYEFTSGKYAHTDYNFETPSTALGTKVTTIVPLPDSKKFEVFEYPGGYLDKGAGGELAKVRIEELEVPYDTVRGESNCATFLPGGKFKLAEHPVDAEKKEYAVWAVEHRATEPSLYLPAEIFAQVRSAHELQQEVDLLGQSAEVKLYYSNSFRCIPADVTFRPARTTAQPRIQGPQPAKVVGPEGNEIYTDEYGRVKVHFPWDRASEEDENSSCWVRVSHNWAGKGWGDFFLPRIGQEVLVEFLEGDPNRPIITGRVYNAEQTHPFKMPDNATQSGIKTRSTDEGDEQTFNELRFEDKKDGEHVYLHAQKDFVRVVENIDTLEVGYDKSQYDQGEGKLEVEGDPGDQVIDIKNNRTVTVHEGTDKLHVLKQDHRITVEEGDQEIRIVTGNQTIDIKTNQEVAIGGDQKVAIDGDQKVAIEGDQKVVIDGDQSIGVGGSISIEAGDSIELKVGSNSITIDSGGITIVGGSVSIEAKGEMGVKGSQVSIQGKMMTEVKSQLNLDLTGEMTSVAGKLVKIN